METDIQKLPLLSWDKKKHKKHPVASQCLVSSINGFCRWEFRHPNLFVEKGINLLPLGTNLLPLGTNLLSLGTNLLSLIN